MLKIPQTISIPEYTVLDYIESNGNQYLDTGKVAADFDELILDYSFVSYSGEWATIIGAWNQTDNSRLVLQKNSTSDYYSLLVGSTTSFNDIALDTNKHRLTYNSSTGISYIDNTAATTGSSNFDVSLVLGALNGDTTVEYNSNARFYNFKLSKNGKTIMHLIPVKNSSDVAGMYDIIADVFYTSVTSTAFIAGSASEQYDFKTIHEVYRKNNSAATYDYVGDMYKKNGSSGYDHIFSAGYENEVGEIAPLNVLNARPIDAKNYEIYGYSEQETAQKDTSTSTVIGIETITNYAYFNKSDFADAFVGLMIKFTIDSIDYYLEVKKIDNNYVYVENKEV